MKLEELLNLYNFRLYRDDLRDENKENSNTIRIYLDRFNWFEFGIDDWPSDKTKANNIKKILDKNLLNQEVESFNVNDDMNMLTVYLVELAERSSD